MSNSEVSNATETADEHANGKDGKNDNWNKEIGGGRRLIDMIINENVDLVTELDDVDVENVPAQKPHFLDYDAVPSPELEDRFAKALTIRTEAGIHDVEQPASVVNLTTNELIKIDKKYERDGEISDFELAASGYTKKEFTQDDNTLHLANNFSRTEGHSSSLRKSVFGKPKHFLDENPIPPDYMLEHELREHRSLDRNFERKVEQQQGKAAALSTSSSNSVRSERKSSLDRGCNFAVDPMEQRYSRERVKSHLPSYALTRFLSSPNAALPLPLPLPPVIPKGAAWSMEQYSSSSCRTNELEHVDHLGPKVECVYSLLSMLGSNDPLDISKKFLELSRSPETCVTLRRSGCIPLLVQMMHSAEADDNVRKFANMALHNVVHSNPDEKAGRLELKVLRLLDKITDYCNFLKTLLQSGGEAIADDMSRHPLVALSSLMRVSFDEEPRHAMCELGALHTIPNLVHLDHAAHGPRPETVCAEERGNDETRMAGQVCNSLRRYALMALTNLTFGDENNKAQLCSQKPFMEALVAQLDSAPDDLLQVTASVLRNLSWRADKHMKSVLNEIGTVTALARAAMKNRNENTLKAILSALWNLSAHCSTNKAEFCAVDGALAFLVDMLTYEGPSKTLKIIENAGGILRNVSSHIAVRENYRKILRERNCLAILLQHLKSESLTVVSNSCGTLWNLSARCPEDQKFLWDNGAVPMLRSLIHSKHEMISEGSSSALKNLFNFRPSAHNQLPLDPIARSMGLKKLPSLNARKQRALEQELGSKAHAETCENLDTHVTEGVGSSKEVEGTEQPNGFDGIYARRLTRSAMLTKSESRDSILSAKSDTTYEHLLRSHSASEANRGKNCGPAFNVQHCAVYALKVEVESSEDVEQPIDYSVKYNETSSKKPKKKTNDTEKEKNGRESTSRKARMPSPVLYQETDLDQPTDFSLRYAETQVEPELDMEGRKLPGPSMNSAKVTPKTESVTTIAATNDSSNNEILLILEDTVKCYQTEDTPYVISNAASITDLHSQVAKADDAGANCNNIRKQATMQLTTVTSIAATTVSSETQEITAPPSMSNRNYSSGSYTPEKPINYCEEGTPGYFSRYDSLSSLDEPPANSRNMTTMKINASKKDILSENKEIPALGEVKNQENKNKTEAEMSTDFGGNLGTTKAATMPPRQQLATNCNEPGVAASFPASTNLNSAQETPLMFSRHSSMDSLIAEDDEIVHCDDKSSVVSDFSRLASGVISPSEIPDSPTQSMPQSPRRNSTTGEQQTNNASTNENLTIELQQTHNQAPLRSVFEDDLSTFHVENTPAQFSCATSLSNLSIADDAGSSPDSKTCKSTSENAGKEVGGHDNHTQLTNAVSEGEEESTTNNDDAYLLANCINIGMHRGDTKQTKTNENQLGQVTPFDETVKKYWTEDTPALLSKVGSNSNLSAISICSSAGENNICKHESETMPTSSRNFSMKTEQRRSLNLSDDVSSNASESGAAAIGQHADMLQQCIRDGMKKKSTTSPKAEAAATTAADPIAMMRRGGSALPRYLPVADEMNKYLVEGSPCNFSTMSGLSNLTVGSSLVGPAIQLKDYGNESDRKNDIGPCVSINAQEGTEEAPTNIESQWHDDSLSSLSIESEDDANLLSQAIAAGCNRPKSNLGFSTSTSSTFGNKRSCALSTSQPIPIGPKADGRQYYNKSQGGSNSNSNVNGNESFSSVDSCDSNDNQSKSLLELCILKGKNKRRSSTHGNSNVRQHHRHIGHHQNRSNLDPSANNASTQSNPNLKQFDSLPVQLHAPATSRAKPSNRHLRSREKNDEKLLLECINTGISRKIVGSSSSSKNPKAQTNAVDSLNIQNRLHGMVGSECAMANCVQPKNVLATSAAALDVGATALASKIANSTNMAATDVDQKKQSEQQYENSNDNTSSSSSSSNSNNQNKICKDIQGAIIGVPVSPARTQHPEDAVLDESGHQSRESQSSKTTRTGFNMANSLDNTNSSDGSNESFIIETTVSLIEQPTCENHALASTSTIVEKHKDPELMLRSVERLTLEFVSSAEQLRTLGSAENSGREKRSLGDGEGTSNNTWNEDTHPNDVSFPSVSISAPLLESLTCEDVHEDIDEEQATEADHKELHDFAEITPTNEEQPQCSLLGYVDVDEMDMFAAGATPQCQSLETETDTLVNDSCVQVNEQTQYHEISESNVSGSLINFKLGGAVQTAALHSQCGHHSYTANSMTNSTLIANEARALAENLLRNDDHGNGEYTYSISSLDLDNIRPPSGMESLNASGYFGQDQVYTASTQPNSLQKLSQLSPQICGKSPKFPRKALPANLMARRALGQLTGSAESVNSSFNLLDNIKPPSLMDELLDSMISVASIQSEIADGCESLATTISVSNYETATAANIGVNRQEGCLNDFDDNTITLHSCCDLTWQCDDVGMHKFDEDCDTGTPLPTDENFSSAESTPQKSLLESSPERRSLTPKIKRQLAKDRFKTYTIKTLTEPEAMEQDEMLQIEVVERETSPRAAGGSVNRRRTSQERYKTQTIVFSSAAAPDCEEPHLSLPTTDECLSDDMGSIRATTRFIHITDDMAEAVQNSETESFHGESCNFAESRGKEKQEMKAIIKLPNEKLENQQDEEVKVVRGRKKATYVSPYSMQYQRSNAAAPAARIGVNKSATASNLTNGGATFLRKRNSTVPTTTTNVTNSKVALKKKHTSNTAAAPVERLERQGTFVKEEPTLAQSDVPIVEPVGAKKSQQNPSPKRTASKLPTKLPVTTTMTSPKHLSSVAKVSAMRKLTTKPPNKPLRSNSNTNMRPATNISTAIKIARVSTTTPPSRSNSNLNATDANSPTNKINQASSRLGGIWKRVNDAKTSSNKSTTPSTMTTRNSSLKPLHTKSSTSLHTQQAQQQLIRSTTFDSIEKKVATNVVKSKLTAPRSSLNGNLNTTARFERRTAHK